MLLLIECGLVLIALIAAVVCPRWGRWLAPVERRFVRLSRHRALSVVLVGVTALGLRLLLLPILPIPQPWVHDEFSYLLAADTFAHGRLTNPPHPMWMHFETFHEIQQPTYASMYFPAQGMFLALGVVFGRPWWGVWLSTGLMCAAICWMLQGWLAPPWALLGGMLAVFRLATFSYWMNSYWGGSVAALGGALVLGALPRIKRNRRVREALLMGLGFAMVANSRPYEGMFFAVPVIGALLWWTQSEKAPAWRVSFSRVLVPLSAVLVLTLAWMAYYFWSVTGSPFRTPLQVNLATYNPVPYFPWQAMKAVPEYRHWVMKIFYTGWWMRQYQFARSHPLLLLLLKSCNFWLFYIGPLLTVPLVVWCFGGLRKAGSRPASTRFLLLVCGMVWLGTLLPVYFGPHYVAPITSAIYAVLMISMRNLRRWRPWNLPSGVALVRAVPAIALLMLLLCAASPAIRNIHLSDLVTWSSPLAANTPRAAIAERLSQQPGQHLVIVQYQPSHVPAFEWVFNAADIDQAKIVWARDMGPEQNSELVRYFHDRRVWTVDPDLAPTHLSPYSTKADSTAASVPPFIRRWSRNRNARDCVCQSRRKNRLAD